MKTGRKKRRPIKEVLGIPIYGNRVLYFNNYLSQQIGANWQPIKNSLYDAGYTLAEVNEYRNGLLKDFEDLCKAEGLVGRI